MYSEPARAKSTSPKPHETKYKTYLLPATSHCELPMLGARKHRLKESRVVYMTSQSDWNTAKVFLQAMLSIRAKHSPASKL